MPAGRIIVWCWSPPLAVFPPKLGARHPGGPLFITTASNRQVRGRIAFLDHGFGMPFR